MNQYASTEELLNRIAMLENENALLRSKIPVTQEGDAVSVPLTLKPLFDVAQETVSEYFRHLRMDPSRGTIEINDQRYVLVRASALSKDFLATVQNLYADRGEDEAMSIGKNFLFDIAHVIGINDARNFHQRMNLTDPIARLSAGPVHFAYSGWAYVDILAESNPTPDENFYLIYHHPYSFEADSWIRGGKKSNTAVCIMNAGYSSGWCEESFGIPLTAVEVSCTARGDKHCTFIMSPPEKIQAYVNDYFNHNKNKIGAQPNYEIPTFFDRKRVEEEMKRSKQLAEESAKLKSDFVANMSHELRTPLSAILGFSDLLQKTKLDPLQKDYADAIHTAGNNLLSIINDVLDLSKMDAGKFIIERVPFSMPELMHSIQVMFSQKAKQKKLKFSCSVDTSINYFALGDPMRLTQILVNLISNALKFTEEGSVFVSCMVEKEDKDTVQLMFTVKDTGIGIPEDKASEIFERFTQADANITRRYGGTGLGLPITKLLVELQGGSISFKNNDGGGVEFSCMLPYAKMKDAQTAHQSATSSAKIAIEPGKNILLVEDNIMNQKLATMILQSRGLNITVAENGERAVEILKHDAFDVILMDIQMPAMDGYKATEIIRNDLHISTPIIAMTAHALAGEREKCLQAGMNDYISKPFDEKNLVGHIAQFISGKKNIYNDYENTIINLDFLKQQTKNNKQLIKEMIEIFKTRNPGDIEQLENNIIAKDFSSIYKTAHSLRNSIGFFGLGNLLNEPLMNTEKLSLERSGLDKIQTDFEKIKIVCAKAVDELKMINLEELS
jgi:CheY-like chemotaxis protein/HPt (histidine-containing phosphotransfer) domain-containing protein